MTDAEIIENNRLIAEFMGLKVLSKEQYLLHPQHATLNVSEYSIIEYQRYSSSWDRLMPVVEKIESLFNGNLMFFIKDTRARIEMGTQYGLTVDIDIPVCYSGICETKIQAAYKTVVEFIKWYNQNKL